MPILPFGKEGQRVGLGSAFEELRQVPTRRVEERESEQKDIVRKYIEGTGEAPLISGDQAKTIATSTNLTEGIQTAELKVPKDLSEYGTAENRAALYKAIEEVYGAGESPEKTDAITRLAPMFKNNGELLRFQQEGLLQIDNNFNTKIRDKITDISTQTQINNLINDNANKPYVDAYFAQHSGSFSKTLTNGTIVTITRISPDTTPPSYTVTVAPPPTP